MRPSPRRDVGGLHSAVGDPAMERVQRPVEEMSSDMEVETMCVMTGKTG